MSLTFTTPVLNTVLILLAGLGILLALFGLRLDYFFAQTFDGLGLSQLLLIVGGLLLSLMCFRLRRGDARRRVWADIREHWRTALLISLVTLLALELILTAGDFPVYYPPDIRGLPIEEAPWWTCDELSCGFVQEAMALDKQNFMSRGFDERPRLLFLGDSFTFGLVADIGKSYVETVKANFPQTVIWNMGMPGNGTNRAWTLFQTYAPSLRPQITVLGFYMNDFDDNEQQSLNGRIIGRRFAWQYGMIASRNGMKLDAHTTYYYVHGLAPPANGIQERIGRTRLGRLALHAIDLVYWEMKGNNIDSGEVNATREYLRLLREATAAQDTALLVLLIPFRSDTISPGLRYQTALRLFEELEMPYLTPIHALDAELDYDLPSNSNSHWNSAGHQKVGAMLSDCLAAFEIRQDLSDCEGVVMP